MEKIDRELLIKEISSRLPYGIKAQVLGWDEEKGEVEVPLKVYSINTDGYLSFEYNHYSVEAVYVEDCRLYLRPISSMTKEEKDKYEERWFDGYHLRHGSDMVEESEIPNYLDWLNAHHFDYRGLIENGLALEAPEGMYN